MGLIFFQFCEYLLYIFVVRRFSFFSFSWSRYTVPVSCFGCSLSDSVDNYFLCTPTGNKRIWKETRKYGIIKILLETFTILQPFRFFFCRNIIIIKVNYDTNRYFSLHSLWIAFFGLFLRTKKKSLSYFVWLLSAQNTCSMKMAFYIIIGFSRDESKFFSA